MIKISNEQGLVEIELTGNGDDVLKEIVEALCFAVYDVALNMKTQPEELLKLFCVSIAENSETLIKSVKEANEVV
jgi:hypothetical protein